MRVSSAAGLAELGGSGLLVPTERLGTGTPSSSTFLRGDQSWVAPGGSAVFTTGTSLPGSPVDGQGFVLRVGSSPYDFMVMLYDGTYGKWVSNPVCVLNQMGNDANPGSSASYTDFAGINEVPRANAIHGFLNLWNGGLRPQVYMSSWFNGGAGGVTVSMRASITYMNDNVTSGAGFSSDQLVTADPSITMTGTSDTFRISDWLDFTGTDPTVSGKAHAHLKLQYKNSGGGFGAIRATTMWLRWVG